MEGRLARIGGFGGGELGKKVEEEEREVDGDGWRWK
jgi:hypothetical protein